MPRKSTKWGPTPKKTPRRRVRISSLAPRNPSVESDDELIDFKRPVRRSATLLTPRKGRTGSVINPGGKRQLPEESSSDSSSNQSFDFTFSADISRSSSIVPTPKTTMGRTATPGYAPSSPPASPTKRRKAQPRPEIPRSHRDFVPTSGTSTPRSILFSPAVAKTDRGSVSPSPVWRRYRIVTSFPDVAESEDDGDATETAILPLSAKQRGKQLDTGRYSPSLRLCSGVDDPFFISSSQSSPSTPPASFHIDSDTPEFATYNTLRPPSLPSLAPSQPASLPWSLPSSPSSTGSTNPWNDYPSLVEGDLLDEDDPTGIYHSTQTPPSTPPPRPTTRPPLTPPQSQFTTPQKQEPQPTPLSEIWARQAAEGTSTFPYYGPACLRCQRATTFRIVKPGNITNGSRPLYKCAPGCGKFATFGDKRGIEPENPPCKCPGEKTSRKDVTTTSPGMGPGKTFWTCAEGACNFWMSEGGSPGRGGRVEVDS